MTSLCLSPLQVLAAFGAAVSSAAPTWNAAVGTVAAAPAAGVIAAAPAAAAIGYGAVGAVSGFAPGPSHVSEQVHAGPAVTRTHVQHGVLGSRTVQAGSRTVQVGHEYNVAGQSVHQPPAYSVVASPATNQVCHSYITLQRVPP